jgi:hypothetical protein
MYPRLTHALLNVGTVANEKRLQSPLRAAEKVGLWHFTIFDRIAKVGRNRGTAEMA